MLRPAGQSVVDDSLDQSRRGTGLGDDVDGESGGTRVERGARSDAGYEDVARQGRELLGNGAADLVPRGSVTDSGTADSSGAGDGASGLGGAE